MKNKLMWIGLILVALGLVLPWATYRATLSGSLVGGGTLLGYQYVQSLLALAISAAGVLVSMKLSTQTRRLLLIASGIVTIGVASSALADLRGPAQEIRVQPPRLSLPTGTPQEIREFQQRRQPGDMVARVSAKPNFGLFVTLLGGALIGVAGILPMRSDRS